MVLALWGIRSSLTPEQPGAITMEKIKRVRKGMTSSEVEAILGRRPEAHLDYSMAVNSDEKAADWWKTWEGGGLTVTYDNTGRVINKYNLQPQGPLERLRDQWRQWFSR
jgi:hypothetical protein